MWTGSLGLSRAEDVEEGRAAMQMNEKICTKIVTNIGGWTSLDSDMIKFTLTPRLYSVGPQQVLTQVEGRRPGKEVLHMQTCRRGQLPL